MKRRFLCIFMVLAILITLLFVSGIGVSAANGNREYKDEYGKSYIYRYCNNNQEVYLVDLLNSVTGELRIPSYIDGKPVTIIGKKAFVSVDATSAVIPDTVKHIEYEAFYDSELESVYIPASVAYIEPAAFSRCGKLKAFSVAEDNLVYSSKNGILCSKDGKILVSYPAGKSKAVVIHEGVEFICEKAFVHAGITSVIFPSTLLGIGNSAFWNTELYDVTFPEGLLYIEDNAFGHCENMTSKTVVNIPESVVYVGVDAFDGVRWEHGYIGAFNINHIAYMYNGTHKEFAIDEHITTIAPKCFSENGRNLEKIYIPASVDEIYLSAFSGCGALTEIIVDENNEYYATYDGMLYSKDFTYLLDCPQGKSGVVTLHENTKYIMSEAFSFCRKITEIKLPENIEDIGNKAFEYCSALEKISIPESVASLGTDLFYECKSLKDIEIKSNVSDICDYDVHDTVWYDNQPGGVLRINDIALGYKNMYENTTELSFDKGIKVIADTAFMGYYNLKEIIFPEELETVGAWAFGNCTGLKSINVPANVSEIGECALGYTYSYDEITGQETVLPIEGFVIKGYTNSVAEAYAKENGFKFESVGVLDVTLLLGDTDFDNVITIKDATRIQKYLANLVEFVSQQRKNADMNKDGSVNIKDATAIQKYIAGLTT